VKLGTIALALIALLIGGYAVSSSPADASPRYHVFFLSYSPVPMQNPSEQLNLEVRNLGQAIPHLVLQLDTAKPLKVYGYDIATSTQFHGIEGVIYPRDLLHTNSFIHSRRIPGERSG
jgi:hypothetical protein